MTGKQISLIVRWDQKVRDSATKLLAISCFDCRRFISRKNSFEDDFLSFSDFDADFTIDVIDIFHEYCFFFRKLIERTETKYLAQKTFPHYDIQMETIIDPITLENRTLNICQKSLWWILSRVIHSSSTMIIGGKHIDLVVYSNGHSREYEDGRYFMEISSDFDRHGETHIIHIPSMVQVYNFSKIRSAIMKKVEENSL